MAAAYETCGRKEYGVRKLRFNAFLFFVSTIIVWGVRPLLADQTNCIPSGPSSGQASLDGCVLTGTCNEPNTTDFCGYLCGLCGFDNMYPYSNICMPSSTQVPCSQDGYINCVCGNPEPN